MGDKIKQGLSDEMMIRFCVAQIRFSKAYSPFLNNYFFVKPLFNPVKKQLALVLYKKNEKRPNYSIKLLHNGNIKTSCYLNSQKINHTIKYEHLAKRCYNSKIDFIDERVALIISLEYQNEMV